MNFGPPGNFECLYLGHEKRFWGRSKAKAQFMFKGFTRSFMRVYYWPSVHACACFDPVCYYSFLWGVVGRLILGLSSRKHAPRTKFWWYWPPKKVHGSAELIFGATAATGGRVKFLNNCVICQKTTRIALLFPLQKVNSSFSKTQLMFKFTQLLCYL